MSYNGLSDIVSLIDEYRELEYLDINIIDNDITNDCSDNDTVLYDSSSYSCEIEDYTEDTRCFTSMVYEIYPNEYYEFVKEFNKYMEYNEYYD